MKYYISQLHIVLNKILKNEINALLLYGPDRGYISEICETIKNKFDMMNNNITYQDFAEGNLEIILGARNFFNQRELIRITNVTNFLFNNVKDIAKCPIYNFPIFIAEELKAGSGVRKFFEDQKNMAILACYHDDEKNIAMLAIKKFTEFNKTIEAEALTYLKTHLHGDHGIIDSELKKIIYYTHDRKNITIDDVKSSLSTNLVVNSDELCIYLAQNNSNRFLKEINGLLTAGANEVLMIRAMIRYYVNIYIILTKLEQNIKLDDAIKTLSPPVFFKYINDFKQIIARINKNQVIKIIKMLQKTEKDFKLNPHSFDFFQQIFLPATN